MNIVCTYRSMSVRVLHSARVAHLGLIDVAHRDGFLLNHRQDFARTSELCADPLQQYARSHMALGSLPHSVNDIDDVAYGHATVRTILMLSRDRPGTGEAYNPAHIRMAASSSCSHSTLGSTVTESRPSGVPSCNHYWGRQDVYTLRHRYIHV